MGAVLGETLVPPDPTSRWRRWTLYSLPPRRSRACALPAAPRVCAHIGSCNTLASGTYVCVFSTARAP
ncbi:hypothetical protein EON67_08625 [archaeon]|nr:MAG: hypothetical protein EON67_08625 [archaeon]